MALSRPISEAQLSDPVHPVSTHQRCRGDSIFFRNSSVSSLSPKLLLLFLPTLQTASAFPPSLPPPSTLHPSPSLFSICPFHSASLTTARLKHGLLLTLAIPPAECRVASCYATYLLIGLLIFCTGEQEQRNVCVFGR